MARNKSEKLPSCGAAIAYAEMVEAGVPGTYEAWWEIPFAVRRHIGATRGAMFNAGALSLMNSDDFSKANAQIIRERYGA